MRNISKKYLTSLFAAGVVLFSLAAMAGDSECDGVQGNLVDNCGWETGCWHGWSANELVLDVGGGEVAHSGAWGGIVHAHEGIEYIGQRLSTVIGQSYTLSFWMRNVQTVDTLQVNWIDGDDVQVPLDLENVPAQNYTYFVIPDLIATSAGMNIYWALGNAQGDIDIDDVVLAPSE
jgi:hypothetical protein